MVALVKNNQLELLDLKQSMHQRIIQLLLREHEHVKLLQLTPPVAILLRTRNVLQRFLVVAGVLADPQRRLRIDRLRLLLYQVSRRHNECNFNPTVSWLLSQNKVCFLCKFLLGLLTQFPFALARLFRRRNRWIVESKHFEDEHDGY